MIYMGIDPGLSGAVAALDAKGKLLGVWDTPTLAIKKGKGTKQTYLTSQMVQIIDDLRLKDNDINVALEYVHAMPGQGTVSMWSMGRGVGLWEGIVVARKLPLVQVTPQQWKRAMIGVKTGDDKKASVLRVQQVLPESSKYVVRRKANGQPGFVYLDDRAEAILIALWLLKQI